MQDTIETFIQTAAKTFKRHYGTYPERIGLDYFSRMQAFNELPYFEHYCWQEMQPIPSPVDPEKWQDLTVTYERVQIKIDPAVFEKVRYAPLTNLAIKPEIGRDEVICEGSGVKVFMTLWFTEQGYHAIVWDKELKNEHR